MGWGRVRLDFSEANDAKLLEKSFGTKWENAGFPEGVALFCRVDSQLKTSEYYFTPEALEFAIDLIEKYKGEEIASETLPRDLAACGGDGGDRYRYLLRSPGQDV